MELTHHSLCGLRPIRQLLQVKASDVAQRLGITVTTYNRFERGERRPYFDQVLAIASFLDIADLRMLTRQLTPDERLDLFRRNNRQTQREHQIADTIQHDLEDHGFPADYSHSGDSRGTVVGAHTHTHTHKHTAGADRPFSELSEDEQQARLLADWGDISDE